MSGESTGRLSERLPRAKRALDPVRIVGFGALTGHNFSKPRQAATRPPGTRCRLLLRVVTEEPAPSYEEVAAFAGMAVGSVGPNRTRCLAGLRRSVLVSA
jgi:hypothetical protein